MHLRDSILLLQAAILAIIFFLALLVGYTLSLDQPSDSTSEGGVIDYIEEASEDQGYRQGKTLWNANGCGACHNKSMKDDAVGPALAGVKARWADYPAEDLYDWIRNNGKLIAEEHPRALKISRQFPGSMNTYSNLSDEDILALLAYIEGQYLGVALPSAP